MPADIALIGCGAIADNFYLPALEKRRELFKSVIVIDKSLPRAEAARARIGAAAATDDLHQVIDRIQGAIVATPHKFHTPLTLELLSHRKHVLCEKPLSDTAEEVDSIIAAAKSAGTQVAVNQTRRLWTPLAEVQRLIASGSIGKLESIEYSLGEEFGWPAETNTYFGTAAGGRGVLFDTGAHIIDLMCWWMGGEPELVSYQDDSRGGTEAVAKVEVRKGSVTAKVHLSWLSKLKNSYRVVGSDAILEGRAFDWSSYMRRDRSGRVKTIRTDKSREFSHFAEKLLMNFAAVMEGKERPTASPTDVRPAISIIDACYKHRTLLEEPWYDTYRRLAHV